MKIWYTIPVLLMLAGCVSAPKSPPVVQVATAPTRAPRPTATPITILSSEVAPPPIVRMLDENNRIDDRTNNSDPNKKLTFDEVPLVRQRGNFSEQEFRYINHSRMMINELGKLQKTLPPGVLLDAPVNFYSFDSRLYERQLKRIIRKHNSFRRPPAMYRNSHAQVSVGLNIMLNAVTRSRSNKAAASYSGETRRGGHLVHVGLATINDISQLSYMDKH